MEAARVVLGMDDYYADQMGPGGLRVASQVAKQLSEPRPHDLSEVDLPSYRQLERRWRDWGAVEDGCRRVSTRVLDGLAEDAS